VVEQKLIAGRADQATRHGEQLCTLWPTSGIAVVIVPA
jgi:hypothetical protein